jgi:hypothetical protein
MATGCALQGCKPQDLQGVSTILFRFDMQKTLHLSCASP